MTTAELLVTAFCVGGLVGIVVTGLAALALMPLRRAVLPEPVQPWPATASYTCARCVICREVKLLEDMERRDGSYVCRPGECEHAA